VGDRPTALPSPIRGLPGSPDLWSECRDRMRMAEARRRARRATVVFDVSTLRVEQGRLDLPGIGRIDFSGSLVGGVGLEGVRLKGARAHVYRGFGYCEVELDSDRWTLHMRVLRTALSIEQRQVIGNR